MKVNVLYFNTDTDAKIERVNVEDGCVKIEDKQFYIDQATPLLLHRSFGVEPLYILKWNSVLPSENLNPTRTKNGKAKILDKILSLKGSKNVKSQTKITKGNGSFEPVEPEFEQTLFKKHKISPEIFRKMMGMKILGNMIKVKKQSNATWWMMLFLGIFIGVMITYYLVYLKVIPI